jgi:peptidoglycan glycosyltransferase
MTVPDGEILALVSLPTYDPNTLDAEWDQLIAAPGNPFFNRVLQGNYQPGGLLQTPLMVEALLRRQPMDAVIDTATRPIRLNDVLVTCAARPPDDDLTLSEAYVFTCPMPFAQLAENLGADAVQSIFDTFNLTVPSTLKGFVVELPEENLAPEATELPTDDHDPLKQALGQGALSMAVMTASVVNAGNAPQPFVLLGVRRPGETDWSPVTEIRPSIPFMTAEVAAQVQALMREAVNTGAAQAARQTGLDIGGHTAVVYSGESAQSWFIGFVKGDSRQSVVAAVVIEDSHDSALASAIGGQILSAGYEAVR